MNPTQYSIGNTNKIIAKVWQKFQVTDVFELECLSIDRFSALNLQRKAEGDTIYSLLQINAFPI